MINRTALLAKGCFFPRHLKIPVFCRLVATVWFCVVRVRYIAGMVLSRALSDYVKIVLYLALLLVAFRAFVFSVRHSQRLFARTRIIRLRRKRPISYRELKPRKLLPK